MPEDQSVRPPLSPDDALPPVEPPSAGFIMQLFGIPAVIVMIIVAVWGLFNWLAQMGDNPRKYVEALRRDNVSRWQVASSLADALRNPMNNQVKEDRQLAGELASILAADLAKTAPNEEDVKLQGFLCKALGEFRVAEGLPTLVKAASSPSGDDRRVQVAALEGMALLASNLPDPQPMRAPDVLQRLIAASHESEPRLRSTAAYAMGVIGGAQAQERLAAMLADAYPDVRYNAATGLARQGDLHALSVLAEMLDPANTAGIDVENEEQARPMKQMLIQANALRAVDLLAGKNREANLAAVAAPIAELAKNARDSQIRLMARDLENKLAER